MTNFTWQTLTPWLLHQTLFMFLKMQLLSVITTLLMALASQVTAQQLIFGKAGDAITINAVPVPLCVKEPDRNTVGRLHYRGGLHLYAEDSRFGGLSALCISADGQQLIALSDSGLWFLAHLVYDEAGALAGLRDTYSVSYTHLTLPTKA